MTVSLASLLIKQTKAQIYQFALDIAELVGLPVTSWTAGDPTRSLYHLESELLTTLEEEVVGFISSGFLDYASGAWLVILADQVFGVVVPEATFATTTVTLTNGGGGLYPISAGDLTFKDSVTNKTYRNTTGGTLASGPGTTLNVDVIADEAGAASSAGAGEIDTLVTELLGVTCSNATAALGIDAPDDAAIRQLCRDKLGAFSPDGPKEAYSYVARNSALTGTTNITRARVYSDSDTGDVTVYIAGPSGAVSSPDVALVNTAILQWATPLCITPTVLSASNVVVPVTYQVWIYKSVNKTEADIKAAILSALETLFETRDIGGDFLPGDTAGKLYGSLVQSIIGDVFPQSFRVFTMLGGEDAFGNIPLANNEVATLGTVTATVTLVRDP
jgi:hypothetical protein